MTPPTYAPGLLPQREAARYVGIGMTKWHQLRSAGKLPQPVEQDGIATLYWRRADLDQYIAKLPPARKRAPVRQAG